MNRAHLVLTVAVAVAAMAASVPRAGGVQQGVVPLGVRIDASRPEDGHVYRGTVRIVADTTDESAALNLDNATPQSDDYKPLLPLISWWANGVRRWSTGFDVGPNYDFVPLYRRDPDNAADSVDVIYVTNEKFPKIGVMRNTPVAQLHVESKVKNRPAVISESAIGTGWSHEWRLNGWGMSGMWADGSLSLGSTAVPPPERLTVYGRVAAEAYRLRGADGSEGELFVEGGALKYRGSRGTVTVIGQP